jgi:hypothetical protein
MNQGFFGLISLFLKCSLISGLSIISFVLFVLNLISLIDFKVDFMYDKLLYIACFHRSAGNFLLDVKH